MSADVMGYTLFGNRRQEHLEIDAMSDAENEKHLVYSEMLHLAIALYAQEESCIAHRLFRQKRDIAQRITKLQSAPHEERRIDSNSNALSRNGLAIPDADSRAIGSQEHFLRNEQE
jgi:hypothetical protein